jgi:hypothetical protein
MLSKHALITALSVFGLIFGIALGISLYRHDPSWRNWVEYAWFVSIAASIIGFYLWKGARTGPDIAGFETESYTIPDKDKYRDADNDGRAKGGGRAKGVGRAKGGRANGVRLGDLMK